MCVSSGYKSTFSVVARDPDQLKKLWLVGEYWFAYAVAFPFIEADVGGVATQAVASRIAGYTGSSTTEFCPKYLQGQLCGCRQSAGYRARISGMRMPFRRARQCQRSPRRRPGIRAPKSPRAILVRQALYDLGNKVESNEMMGRLVASDHRWQDLWQRLPRPAPDTKRTQTFPRPTRGMIPDYPKTGSKR
jgi:hypothetical protein